MPQTETAHTLVMSPREPVAAIRGSDDLYFLLWEIDDGGVIAQEFGADKNLGRTGRKR